MKLVIKWSIGGITEQMGESREEEICMDTIETTIKYPMDVVAIVISSYGSSPLIFCSSYTN